MGSCTVVLQHVLHPNFSDKQNCQFDPNYQIQIVQHDVCGKDVYKTWTPGPWTTPVNLLHGPAL